MKLNLRNLYVSKVRWERGTKYFKQAYIELNERNNVDKANEYLALAANEIGPKNLEKMMDYVHSKMNK